MTTLEFAIAGGERIVLEDPAVFVAGYTGRDEESVRRHIDELAAIGVAPPPQVPMFYPMPAGLASQAEEFRDAGELTSGEVEPVYIRHAGAWYLSVGSDHTDRVLEAEDIARSKAACPKPVGRRAVLVTDLASFDIDDIIARTTRDGVPYQEGRLAALRQPADVIARLEEAQDVGDGDLLCLGGTIPLLDGGFQAGSTWGIELELPDGTLIAHQYDMHHEEERA